VEDLRKQAQNFGLDIEEGESQESIKKKLAAAGVSTSPVPKAKPKKGFMRILIHEQQDEPSKVFVAVQGKAFLIKRGEPVDVPHYVVHALQNAKGLSISMPDGKMIKQPFQRYPFQFA
jgi:hypothetical protein